jgi:hypothetical protein
MTPWLADAHGIALITGRKPSTIRSWASRGHLTRHGTSPQGRTLYNVEEAEELAARLMVETPATLCNTETSAPACPDNAGSTPGGSA